MKINGQRLRYLAETESFSCNFKQITFHDVSITAMNENLIKQRILVPIKARNAAQNGMKWSLIPLIWLNQGKTKVKSGNNETRIRIGAQKA